jgi:heat shock protein HslJ
VSIEGRSIRLSPGPTTLMACPPPLDALERALGDTLGKVRAWRIQGNTLELADGAGASLALLEAVYF